MPRSFSAGREAPPWEPHSRESLNHGSDQQLIINGRNGFALLALDVSPARGLRVEKAVLRVRREPPRLLAVSPPRPVDQDDVGVGCDPARWSTKRLRAEIDKCDVVCANCHYKLHAREAAE